MSGSENRCGGKLARICVLSGVAVLLLNGISHKHFTQKFITNCLFFCPSKLCCLLFIFVFVWKQEEILYNPYRATFNLSDGSYNAFYYSFNNSFKKHMGSLKKDPMDVIEACHAKKHSLFLKA